jgi:hypothetical protein
MMWRVWWAVIRGGYVWGWMGEESMFLGALQTASYAVLAGNSNTLLFGHAFSSCDGVTKVKKAAAKMQ